MLIRVYLAGLLVAFRITNFVPNVQGKSVAWTEGRDVARIMLLRLQERSSSIVLLQRGLRFWKREDSRLDDDC